MAHLIDIPKTINALIDGDPTDEQKAEAAHLLLLATYMEEWESTVELYSKLLGAGVLRGVEPQKHRSE